MRQYIVIGILILAIAVAATVQAWDDCPFGLVNDPWPGGCGRYVDTDNNGLCDHSEPAPSDPGTATIVPISPVQTDPVNSTNLNDNANSVRSHSYNVLEIGILLSAFYFITFLATKEGQMTTANHRKLWNWLLLGTFLISGILGLIMAISLDNGWTIPFADSLYIHVEFAIAMAFISIYHVLWHWKYYAGSREKPPAKKSKNKNKRRN